MLLSLVLAAALMPVASSTALSGSHGPCAIAPRNDDPKKSPDTEKEFLADIDARLAAIEGLLAKPDADKVSGDAVPHFEAISRNVSLIFRTADFQGLDEATRDARMGAYKALSWEAQRGTILAPRGAADLKDALGTVRAARAKVGN